jgi:hypothetical protein
MDHEYISSCFAGGRAITAGVPAFANRFAVHCFLIRRLLRSSSHWNACQHFTFPFDEFAPQPLDDGGGVDPLLGKLFIDPMLADRARLPKRDGETEEALNAASRPIGPLRARNSNLLRHQNVLADRLLNDHRVSREMFVTTGKGAYVLAGLQQAHDEGPR